MIRSRLLWSHNELSAITYYPTCGLAPFRTVMCIILYVGFLFDQTKFTTIVFYHPDTSITCYYFNTHIWEIFVWHHPNQRNIHDHNFLFPTNIYSCNSVIEQVCQLAILSSLIVRYPYHTYNITLISQAVLFYA